MHPYGHSHAVSAVMRSTDEATYLTASSTAYCRSQWYLRELERTLQLRGWFTRIEPTGVRPRLYVWHPNLGAVDEGIYVRPRAMRKAELALHGTEPDWWVAWMSGELICRASDMRRVGWLLAARAGP